MKIRIPLAKNRYATVFSCYAPTLDSADEDKDTFYEMLDAQVQSVPLADKLLVLSDFNARVGSAHQAWPGVLGCQASVK